MGRISGTWLINPRLQIMNYNSTELIVQLGDRLQLVTCKPIQNTMRLEHRQLVSTDQYNNTDK